MAVKKLRSLIQEAFPLAMREELAKLSDNRRLSNDQKYTKLFQMLHEQSLDITKLGPGTNRYAFKHKGLAIKFATDRDGIIDNLKEASLSKRLRPHVIDVHEVSDNGTIMVCEYVQPFEGFMEMKEHEAEIRKFLTEISAVYLIGDVGISPKNFGNYGKGRDGKIKILDFAYAYEISSELFICKAPKCRAQAMMGPTSDFVNLICPACGKVTPFEQIRGRIGNAIHRHNVGNLADEGYLLTESGVTVELDTVRSPYLQKNTKKEKRDYDVSRDDDDEFNGIRWN